MICAMEKTRESKRTRKSRDGRDVRTKILARRRVFDNTVLCPRRRHIRDWKVLRATTSVLLLALDLVSKTVLIEKLKV